MRANSATACQGSRTCLPRQPLPPVQGHEPQAAWQVASLMRSATALLQVLASLGMEPAVPLGPVTPPPEALPLTLDGLLLGHVPAALVDPLVGRLRALKVALLARHDGQQLRPGYALPQARHWHHKQPSSMAASCPAAQHTPRSTSGLGAVKPACPSASLQWSASLAHTRGASPACCRTWRRPCTLNCLAGRSRCDTGARAADPPAPGDRPRPLHRRRRLPPACSSLLAWRAGHDLCRTSPCRAWSWWGAWSRPTWTSGALCSAAAAWAAGTRSCATPASDLLLQGCWLQGCQPDLCSIWLSFAAAHTRCRAHASGRRSGLLARSLLDRQCPMSALQVPRRCSRGVAGPALLPRRARAWRHAEHRGVADALLGLQPEPAQHVSVPDGQADHGHACAGALLPCQVPWLPLHAWTARLG